MAPRWLAGCFHLIQQASSSWMHPLCKAGQWGARKEKDKLGYKKIPGTIIKNLSLIKKIIKNLSQVVYIMPEKNKLVKKEG